MMGSCTARLRGSAPDPRCGLGPGVAVYTRQKEAVYWLPRRREWAVVHLTWNDEMDPRWPSTVLCPTWISVIHELADRGRA